METLSRLGVGLNALASGRFCSMLPPFVKAKDSKFVLSLIDELKSAGTGVNAMRLGEDMVTKTVCRHAIKANDALAEPELEALLEPPPLHLPCPRPPTLIEMSYPELEKKFGGRFNLPKALHSLGFT